jgi:short-subunit dehydrogenase
MVAAGLLAGTAATTGLARKRLARRRSPLRPELRKGLALVTGASSGLGAAFARQLAARGFDLLLVARRADRLDQLAGELRRAYRVNVECLPADLSDPAGVDGVVQRIRELDGIAVLVNNAGFDVPLRFVEADIERLSDMNAVHVDAAIRLSHAALPAMLRARRGALVNVSSVSAFAPLVGNAIYSATKAYLVNFSEALAMELAGSGVFVQALCPGFTHTELHAGPEFELFRRLPLPEFIWMTADAVARASLESLGSGQVIVVPGIGYRLGALFFRLPVIGRIPEQMVSALRNLTGI